MLTHTDGLSREEWLEFRRKGIGGSDAAAVLGISPFRTGVDLYYDKLGLPVEDNEGNWVAMEVGTLLEDLVARIFAKKTGLKVCPMPAMFQHPDHPWMLADIDRLVTLPDGSTAILECKTTNYNARDKWEYDGKPIVPPYYEAQGKHYMAVLDLDYVYYCCFYGNNEDEVIIRRIDRDKDYESELIALEENFWINHVQAKVPPPYVERDGELILDSLRRCLGPSYKDAPPVALTQAQSTKVLRYQELQVEKSALNAEVKKLGDEMEHLNLSWLQRPKAGVRDLLMLRILRKEGHEPSQEMFLFLEEYGITEVEGLACALRYSTPHKVVRYLVQQFAKGDPGNYRGHAGILSDYKDYTLSLLVSQSPAKVKR